MQPDEILTRFALLAQLSEAEAAPFLPLCGEAAASIRRQLKSGINETTYDSELTAAAAALAFYRYALLQAANDTGDFKAGDVSISRRGPEKVQFAEAVYKEAKAEVAGLLLDADFVFERV